MVKIIGESDGEQCRLWMKYYSSDVIVQFPPMTLIPVVPEAKEIISRVRGTIAEFSYRGHRSENSGTWHHMWRRQQAYASSGLYNEADIN